MHRRAGVNRSGHGPALRALLTLPQPNDGSCEEDEPGTRRTELLEMGAQTQQQGDGPVSHPPRLRPQPRGEGHRQRVPASRAVSRGQPRAGRGFSRSQPGTRSSVWDRSPAAPAAGKRAVDATSEGSPLAAVRFEESRRAVKHSEVHRDPTTRRGKTRVYKPLPRLAPAGDAFGAALVAAGRPGARGRRSPERRLPLQKD